MSANSSFMDTNCRDLILVTSLADIGGRAEDKTSPWASGIVGVGYVGMAPAMQLARDVAMTVPLMLREQLLDGVNMDRLLMADGGGSTPSATVRGREGQVGV